MLSPRRLVSCVMLAALAAFHLCASAGTAIDRFVCDRYDKQFVPVWTQIVGTTCDAECDPWVVPFLAQGSQAVIALVEFVIGTLLVAAIALPCRRIGLASIAVTLSVMLFSTFSIVMFALHDPDLPKWTQYPAVLAWITTTWIVAVLAESTVSGSERNHHELRDTDVTAR